MDKAHQVLSTRLAVQAVKGDVKGGVKGENRITKRFVQGVQGKVLFS